MSGRLRTTTMTTTKTKTALLSAAAASLLLAAVAPAPAVAQARALDRGVVGTGLLLRQLDGVKSVLMIGAHPDDEDTALLAALARGHGARTAYLSLTRGGGGQNLIGPELDEGLGVVRTGELVAARDLDGGRQYFTRARDYGYSKSAEEAFTQWDREALLRDIVWVVRSFRPQVIVSIFSGTPRDGHGQHQAAGMLAHEAFELAADPDAFPDQLDEGVGPWRAHKLYREAWFQPERATTTLPVGGYDPLLGRSWFQLAMESRSQHRSQDMGAPQPLGPREASLILAKTAPGVTADAGDGFFAGVDTTLGGRFDALPPEHGPRAGRLVLAYREAIAAAGESLNALSPSDAVPHLAEASGHLRAARDLALRAGAGETTAPLRDLLDQRVRLLDEAIRDAAGIVVDVRAEDDLVVPGQSVEVEVEVWNGGPFALVAASPGLDLPSGWSAAAGAPGEERSGRGPFRGRRGSPVIAPGEDARVAPGEAVRWRYRVELPADAEPSELYYLEEPLDGAMYRWPDDPGVRALPRGPALVTATVRTVLDVPVADGGSREVAVETTEAARYVGVDPARGEFTRPLLVVPAVSAEAQPRVMVVPAGATGPRNVSVGLRAFAPEGARGTLRLEAPPGWRVEPASVPFDVAGEGREESATFTVHPPADAAAGRYALRPVAETGGGRPGGYDRAVRLVDYPHIERALMLRDGATDVTVVPVRVADRRVGYVMGSGDDGVEAIRQLGLDVDLLDSSALREGDLSRFDVIVLGIRAYEVREDLQASNQRLLDWVRDGGTLLVQYNKYEFPRGGYAPFPVEMARPHDRVTDEESPVAFLHPDNPVFNHPNAIDPRADFEGWVTERGLYFLSEWDEDRMTPVLGLTDFGEEPKRGSIVVGEVGEGLWIYTGLSFFRQLPAGVPGAYRLFANLLSLDAAEWEAWASAAAGGAGEGR